MQLLVIITIHLQISLMFLHSPNIHLKEARNGKKQSYS